MVEGSSYKTTSDQRNQSTAETRKITVTHGSGVPALKSPTNKNIFRCLFDYSASGPSEISFKQHDRLEITNKDGDWWYAKHLNNGQLGYVPSNYVVAENSLDFYDWYHGNITRKRAEKDLFAPGNIRFTFLIRDSETAKGGFALSVLDESESGEKLVRHYRIRSRDSGNGFYLTTKNSFPTLRDLIDFYKGPATDGLVQLSRPCAKAKPSLWDMSYDMRDRWEIDRDELQFGTSVGSGKFGDVVRGLWRQRPVAIKTLKFGSMDPAKFLEEAKVMKTLQHCKLIALLAVCSRQEPFYIVTELMSNGSLLVHLRRDEGRRILLPNLIDFAAQVAEGMQFIELKGYVHRDLAARNILVGDNNQVKIGDFGLAIAINAGNNGYTSDDKFPIKWTAPEAIRSHEFTIKSDVWAYGILLVELATYGAMPYAGLSNKEVLQFLESGKRHPQPAGCPEPMYEQMLYCWKRNPQDRPTFERLFDFMENYAVQTEVGYQEN